jgi:hypothetical protein
VAEQHNAAVGERIFRQFIAQTPGCRTAKRQEIFFALTLQAQAIGQFTLFIEQAIGFIFGAIDAMQFAIISTTVAVGSSNESRSTTSRVCSSRLISWCRAIWSISRLMINSPFRPGGIQPPPRMCATTDKKGKKSCCYGNMLPFHQQTDFDLCHNIPATVMNTLNNCSVSWSTYWKT